MLQLNNEPRYAVKINNRWLPDMIGGVDSEGSSETWAGIFGYSINAITISGVSAYRVATEKSGWTSFMYGYDKDNPAGDGTDILALEIHDRNVLYMVHTKGGSWSKPVYGNEPGFVGHMVPIDGVQIIRM